MAANILRCVVEIDGGQVRVHLDGSQDFFKPRDFTLTPETPVHLKGQIFKLGELLAALIDHKTDWLYQWFDERGQLDTGAFLYDALFGSQPPEKITGGAPRCDLRINTTDEDIARLPWILIAQRGVFLATAGWSIALGAIGAETDCELPPSPKLLVAAPESTDWPTTEAEAHIKELQDQLSAADASYIDDSRLHVARTWKAFLAELSKFQPDILYYYGHGTGDRHRTHLVFAEENGSACEISIADLAVELRNRLLQPLLVVYINCCQGDAGGILGAGRQLVNVAPVVLTNRTSAFVNAARAQGLAFWDDLIVRGLAPQQAVMGLYAALGDLGLTLADYRWMTPVLHCRYGDWQSNPPMPLSREERDPDWKFKLDRVNQFSRVFYQTHQMLLERRPKALAFLWFGAPNQGMEIFHERLNRELQEKLKDVLIYPVYPEWPEELANPSRSFSDMLTQAFKVSDPEQITGRIRAYSRQRTGQRTLVYVRHTPVLQRAIFDPQSLPTYLEWWSRYFVPRLPELCHALLGVSYAVSNPAKFHQTLHKKLALDKLDLGDTVLVILDALERVTLQDLRDFIRTHNIRLPQDLQERILEKLLADTDGSYEGIIEEMKHLESRAWRESLQHQQSGQADDDEDDGMSA